MNWKDQLSCEIEGAYKSANSLIDLVDADKLNWKPATGNNWMTTGQLLKHISDACGSGFKGFVTGDWGLPEGVDMSKLSPEEMMPPAEKMTALTSVAEAKKLLEADKQVALAMLAKASAHDLENKPAPAPWDPSPTMLGPRLAQMVDHLVLHKAQLFYYLKLQGKPVHTGHLWGM
jgi:uncharacterized damage-inducible protein DinB